MPTNKELLEAEAFHRRRLVAALVTGSPESHPPRILRPLVGGMLIALLVVAGHLAARYLGA